MIQFLITSLHNNNSKSLASVQRVDRAHFNKPLVHYFTVCFFLCIIYCTVFGLCYKDETINLFSDFFYGTPPKCVEQT